MKAAPLVPLMIATAAAGAVELALVISKPIPTYRSGGKHKEDGPMIVHPGEMIVDPSGKISMTPNKPETLMFVKLNTEIIPAHKVNQMRLTGVLNENSIPVRKDKTEEYLATLIELNQAQVSFMKKKQPIHNHIHIHTGFESHIDNAVRN